MKIKTRLRLNTWFSLGAIIFMLLALIWSLVESGRADRNVLLVHEIERAAFERIILRDDWLLNREERAKSQWYAKSEMLRNLIQSTSDKFVSEEKKEILLDMQKDFEATFLLFSSILGRQKNQIKENNRVFNEAETRTISQVFLRAYSLSNNISRLHELCRKEAIAARTRGIIFIIIFIIGGITAMIINSAIINKLVARRVETLEKGLAIIGGGDLKYRINTKGNDELTELAQKVNELTEKLQQSYTSVENLQKEIARRKKAEENIKIISAHQQTLLESMPDIIMEVDLSKIYTWANKPGLDFFGDNVLGKEASSYFIGEQDTYAKVETLFKGSKGIIYLESWQRRKDGQERLLAWWCRALHDAQGNVAGALSSARDITEQKMAENEIKKLNEELEKRVAKRTADLTAKSAELERINRVFVDRELRMRELKARIAELEKKREA